MAFLKNLSGKIGSAAGSAADKARKLAEITKLNSAISAEEKAINKSYLEIGRQTFEQEQANPDSPVAELCQEILAAQQRIEELQQRIVELKSEGTGDVTEETAEAQAAGFAEQPAQVKESAPSHRFCTECGAENTSESKFCVSCGSNMSQE